MRVVQNGLRYYLYRFRALLYEGNENVVNVQHGNLNGTRTKAIKR